MTRENAIITAANGAAKLDIPAYVVWEGEADTEVGWQVYIMDYSYLTEKQRGQLGHIVTPEGAVFDYVRQAP